jgi:hypothetical protein
VSFLTLPFLTETSQLGLEEDLPGIMLNALYILSHLMLKHQEMKITWICNRSLEFDLYALNPAADWITQGKFTFCHMRLY